MTTERVILVGRDTSALEALRIFAKRHADISVEVSTDPATALRRASLILCQVRVGGASARLSDEAAPQRWGAWGDETLGIGGLRSALRAADWIADCARRSKGAPCLMFTNPTDLLARLWAAHSNAPCISICEMPTLLLHGLTPHSRYLGVNHLGFAVSPDLTVHASKWVDLLEDLPAHVARQRQSPPRRATDVASLALRLRQAIRLDDITEVDNLLAQRPPRWYSLLVVPLINHFLTGAPFQGVVGLPNGDRLPSVDRAVVVETVSRPAAPLPLTIERKVAPEVAGFAQSRQYAYECIRDFTPLSLDRFLASDPFTKHVLRSSALYDWMSGVRMRPADADSPRLAS
jgi:6-phospho-beta-glucosidase